MRDSGCDGPSEHLRKRRRRRRAPPARAAASSPAARRSRSGAVAGPTTPAASRRCPARQAAAGADPADRDPGRPWRPGTPPPAPLDDDTPSADIRIGYARCSHLTQELQSQLDALAAHGIPRDKIFSEKISTRVRVRPQFEAALTLAREIKAHAPHCRVIFTVYEMKRLGRDAAELTALADHLTAHGLVLEMLAGPLPGIYDPTGPGRLLFAFFAAMAETERENIRESTLEGLDAAARKGKHGGRPPVITDDMLHTVLRRRAARRVRRADPPGPDHPHRQAQGPEPRPGQHLPGARRAREEPGVPRSRRSRPTPTSPPSRPTDSSETYGIRCSRSSRCVDLRGTRPDLLRRRRSATTFVVMAVTAIRRGCDR